MKKKQVYTPLFDTEEEYVPKATCLCCGKSVKETLINNDGICIECIMNNKINSNDACLLPNQNVFTRFFQEYKLHSKKKSKENATMRGILFGLGGGFLGGMAAGLTAEAINPGDPTSKFYFINKKITEASFEQCNKMTVTIQNEAWICPCCNHDNSGAHFCAVCGVYPKFKLED